MRKVIFINLAILLAIAGPLAYWVFGSTSVPERAMAAYKAGNYAAALPLFKEWAKMPGVRNDQQKHDMLYNYISQIEATQTANAASASPATNPAGTPAAATGPAGDPNLMAQAMSYALQSGAPPGDPPMGADRISHKAPKPGEVLAMSIKQMGNFDFDPNKDADVPADVKLLDGAHVRLSGFMIPLDQTEKISNFALVPSLMNCCFGQPPGVQHIITCRLPSSKAVEYAVDELNVEGVVHVNVKRIDGFTQSIFELDVSSVRIKE